MTVTRMMRHEAKEEEAKRRLADLKDELYLLQAALVQTSPDRRAERESELAGDDAPEWLSQLTVPSQPSKPR